MNKSSLLMILLLFLAAGSVTAQAPRIVSCQYWFNDQVQATTTLAAGDTSFYQLETAISVPALPPGLHRFNIRFSDDSLQFSQVYTSWFVNINSDLINGYEYWFNGDSENKVTVNVETTAQFELTAAFSAPELSGGLNTFHMRFRSTNGHFSPVQSYTFYYNTTPGITGYEYWFNDAVAEKVSVPVSSTQLLDLTTAFETAGLTEGMHTLNIRFRNGSGQWSVVSTGLFYKHGGTGTQNLITSYEYWFDQAHDAITAVEVGNLPESEVIAPIDASSLDPGLHVVHIRFNSGLLSSVTKSSYFYKSGSTPLIGDNMINGYRFWFNSDTAQMTQVSIQQPVKQIVLLGDIELPYLPLGRHLMSVDFSDLNGQYSSVISDSITVTVCTPYAARQMTGFAEACRNTQVQYSIPSITNATGYLWTLPPGAEIVSGENTNSVWIYFSDQAESGMVSARGVNPCGEGNPSSIAVTITPTPLPTITGDTMVCVNSEGHIYTTEPGCQNYAWNVTPGGHVQAGWGTNQVVVHWVTQEGGVQEITVNYSNQDGCNGVNTLQVSVMPPPPASQPISGGTLLPGTEFCEDASEILTVPDPGNTFHIGAGASAILMSGERILLKRGLKADSGSYFRAYITDDCLFCNALLPGPLPSPSISFSTATGIRGMHHESAGEIGFSVLPNPTSGKFRAELAGEYGKTTIQAHLMNMQGQLLASWSGTGSDFKKEWSLEGNPPGIYLLKITSDKKTGSARIMLVK